MRPRRKQTPFVRTGPPQAAMAHAGRLPTPTRQQMLAVSFFAHAAARRHLRCNKVNSIYRDEKKLCQPPFP